MAAKPKKTGTSLSKAERARRKRANIDKEKAQLQREKDQLKALRARIAGRTATLKQLRKTPA